MFQNPPATTGTRGQRDVPFVAVDHGTADGKVAAQVRHLSGQELEIARQVHPRATIEVTIRQPKTQWSVNASQRIIFKNKTLAIAAPPRDESDNELGDVIILTCVEVQ